MENVHLTEKEKNNEEEGTDFVEIWRMLKAKIKMWSKCYSKTHFMLCMIPSSTCRILPQWCAQADPGPLPWCVTRQSRHPHLDGHRQRGRRGGRSSPTCSVMFWVCIIVCCDIIMILNNFKQFPYCRWGWQILPHPTVKQCVLGLL